MWNSEPTQWNGPMEKIKNIKNKDSVHVPINILNLRSIYHGSVIMLNLMNTKIHMA